MLVARYLFPTLLGGFVLCDVAIGWLESRFNVARFFEVWRIAFLTGAVGFFAIEIVLQCV
jgi:hypothetical protein